MNHTTSTHVEILDTLEAIVSTSETERAIEDAAYLAAWDGHMPFYAEEFASKLAYLADCVD